MPALDPLTFFLWDKPRLLVDIRPHNSFVNGSLENAISIPIEEYKNPEEFFNHIQIKESGLPLQMIDLDGEIAGQLSELTPSIFLEGGYKSFKTWRNNAFETGQHVKVLAGYTGSGKTELLRFLDRKGYQVIDLESLAVHRGSAFGKIRGKNQPLHEYFQNKLLKEWLNLDDQKPVWIEEKGPFLGKTGLPESLQKKMQHATLYHLEVPFKERLQYLIKAYDDVEPHEFENAIKNLESRMGTSNNHKASHFYKTGQIRKCFELLLKYYDKAYAKRREMGWKGQLVKIAHSHKNLMGTLNQIERL